MNNNEKKEERFSSVVRIAQRNEKSDLLLVRLEVGLYQNLSQSHVFQNITQSTFHRLTSPKDGNTANLSG
jgi:hypothetical protein